jgi:hypothetical protein
MGVSLEHYKELAGSMFAENNAAGAAKVDVFMIVGLGFVGGSPKRLVGGIAWPARCMSAPPGRTA